ncbi:c-type cytochrome [Sphingomonas desiccabilis]|uniref:Cytochrome C n=1 Tax=Sphingomonas desiccabilis TaxID=429134 RepID=A0A4Q2IUU2_9SPHN|nr:cytochrome C [Sphingomonas desiccabilis]MBB3911024.1 cytochrome c [Sphingomonas desiccabilis]RXZ32158.1 cytochrome C [Sphingomonas desiccabilis]
MKALGGLGALLLPAALAGCRGETPRAALPQPAAFAACQTCHRTTPGASALGPSLAGLADRRAGSLPGYGYSPALQKLEGRWDEPRLTAFLLDPTGVMPGTRMAFAGLEDRKQATEVARYVLSLPEE